MATCERCLGTGYEPDRELNAWRGKEARDRRQRAGLKQEELAGKMGIERSYVSHLEAGRKTWTATLWRKLVKATR